VTRSRQLVHFHSTGMAPRAPELPPYERPQFMRNASSQSKVSVSPSNEADDEQSLSDEQSIDMESNDAPHYEGEDTRLTSDKELRGFYMYGWAAEVLILTSPQIYIHSSSFSFSFSFFQNHARRGCCACLNACGSIQGAPT
jgi:hypothetical protein